MSTRTFKQIRLGLALAAALTGFGAWAAGGAPGLSFNTGFVGLMTGVGQSAALTPDPMLANASSSPAVISAITLSGANAGEFRISGGAIAPCAVGGTIPRSGSAGNFCAVHLTFNPTSLGIKAATATVTFADASTASIGLSAEALVPVPVAVVQALANPLPDVAVGATGVPYRAAYVSNPGAQGLGISSFTISGPHAADFAITPVIAKGNAVACTTVDLLGWSPPPGVGCQIGMAFRPSALGARSAVLTLATNDPARPTVAVPLAGNGVVAPPPPPAPVASTVYITDLWWNPAEPAWSLNIVHHKVLVVGGTGSDAVVATWNTFNASTAPTWFTVSGGSWTSGQSYTGVLRQSTGSYFASAYLPGQAINSVVGSATLSFTDANNGTLSYTVSGVTSSRAITRKAF